VNAVKTIWKNAQYPQPIMLNDAHNANSGSKVLSRKVKSVSGGLGGLRQLDASSYPGTDIVWTTEFCFL